MKHTSTRTPDLGVNQEGTDRQQEFLSVRTLARTAHAILSDLGIRMSGCQVRKLIRRFVREGHTATEFRTWFLSYADPTGETAVHNVLRESR